eukprot:Hpha_TRINITY_DN35548_c0_g1::TRINITY_DN35548_c0_g1_i1::g.84596::m.84596
MPGTPRRSPLLAFQSGKKLKKSPGPAARASSPPPVPPRPPLVTPTAKRRRRKECDSDDLLELLTPQNGALFADTPRRGDPDSADHTPGPSTPATQNTSGVTRAEAKREWNEAAEKWKKDFNKYIAVIDKVAL